MRSILDPPPRNAIARFREGFGPRFLVTVDAEEESDWGGPLARDEHDLPHLQRLAEFQRFCESHGIGPVYMVDWPFAASGLAAAALGDAVRAGRAEIGAKLHPWVNPPFDKEPAVGRSFAASLSPSLEEAKLAVLCDTVESSFGIRPLIHRAGRYGVGKETARILRDGGVALDSSVRAKFDYRAQGGPDYSAHPIAPYWLDDARSVLELPLTTAYWGLLRRQGAMVFPRLAGHPALRGSMARACLLQRIPLTPEGVSVDEAVRAIDMALDDGVALLVLAFHGRSLMPGLTPPVRDEGHVETLYDWWRRVIAYLDLRGVCPAGVDDIMQSVIR